MNGNLVKRFAEELTKNGIRTAVGKTFLKIGNKLIPKRKTVTAKPNISGVPVPETVENFEIQFGGFPKDYRRLAVFASFSADGLIHKDVIFYLNELNRKLMPNLLYVKYPSFHRYLF